jgi:hypothetical protein
MPTARQSLPVPSRPRRALLPFLLAACVLLAGCASLSGADPTASATPTDSPPPDAPSATRPPGVSASGVDDPAALAAAHRRATADAGFVLVARTTVRQRGPPVLDGPDNRTRTVRVVAAPGLARYRERRRTLDADGCLAVDRWSNGSVATRRRVATSGSTAADSTGDAAGDDPTAGSGDADRRVDYGPAPPTAAAPDLTLASVLERTLPRADYALVAVRTVANGSDDGTAGRRYVLSADDYVPRSDEAVEADRIGLSSRLVVDGRGRVRALQATVVRNEWTKWGQSRRVRSVSYRLVAVGVGPAAVPRPTWLGAARDADGLRRAAGDGTPRPRSSPTPDPPTGPLAPLGEPNETACVAADGR